MNAYLFLTRLNEQANAGNGGEGAPAGFDPMSLLPMALPVLLLVVMYFFMIRPQQKKQKEEQKMRNSLRVGDELTTIGGIKGRVVAIKDDTITLETSNDRTKIVFEKAAIGTVHTKHEDPIDDDDDDDDDI